MSLGDSKTKPGSKKAVKMKPRDLVFNTLIGHITKIVAVRKPDGMESYYEHFAKSVGELGLSKSSEVKLLEWSQEQGSPTLVGTDKDVQKIINTAFIWLCGKFGPVMADKILLQAVKLTEDLPEAFEHSPRNFL